MNKNLELLKTSLLYSSYLDTLGYNNGKWEKNFDILYVNLNLAIELNYRYVTEFFRNGGLKNSLKNKIVSDDTLLQLITTQSIINNIDFINLFMGESIKLIHPKRFTGETTLQAIKFYIDHDSKAKLIPYHNLMGGNGPATRTPPIGILLDNPDEIIMKAFLNSITTHNYTVGFLGGIASALITYFAKKEIPILKWLDELLKYEKKIDNIIKSIKKYPNFKEFQEDKKKFWNKIKDYKEYRLNQILNEQHPNPKTQLETFAQLLNRPVYNAGNYAAIGRNGSDSILFTYESFIKSYHNNEIDLTTLIIYSTLHSGDNDSTGAIAGAWYGAFYKKMNPNLDIKNLEFYDYILDLTI